MKKNLSKLAIGFGFGGKFLKDIKTFKTNLKKLNIKFMSEDHASPHITIIAGETYEHNQKKIYQIIKKKNIKKFKLISPGLGIYANKSPNLHVRWEQSNKLLNTSNGMIKQVTALFKNNKNALNDSFWLPKTTLAWIDLKYSHLNSIFLNFNYMFMKRSCLIDRIYFMDFTKKKENIVYKIKLK